MSFLTEAYKRPGLQQPSGTLFREGTGTSDSAVTARRPSIPVEVETVDRAGGPSVVAATEHLPAYMRYGGNTVASEGLQAFYAPPVNVVQTTTPMFQAAQQILRPLHRPPAAPPPPQQQQETPTAAAPAFLAPAAAAATSATTGNATAAAVPPPPLIASAGGSFVAAGMAAHCPARPVKTRMRTLSPPVQRQVSLPRNRTLSPPSRRAMQTILVANQPVSPTAGRIFASHVRRMSSSEVGAPQGQPPRRAPSTRGLAVSTSRPLMQNQHQFGSETPIAPLASIVTQPPMLVSKSPRNSAACLDGGVVRSPIGAIALASGVGSHPWISVPRTLMAPDSSRSRDGSPVAVASGTSGQSRLSVPHHALPSGSSCSREASPVALGAQLELRSQAMAATAQEMRRGGHSTPVMMTSDSLSRRPPGSPLTSARTLQTSFSANAESDIRVMGSRDAARISSASQSTGSTSPVKVTTPVPPNRQVRPTPGGITFASAAPTPGTLVFSPNKHQVRLSQRVTDGCNGEIETTPGAGVAAIVRQIENRNSLAAAARSGMEQTSARRSATGAQSGIADTGIGESADQASARRSTAGSTASVESARAAPAEPAVREPEQLVEPVLTGQEPPLAGPLSRCWVLDSTNQKLAYEICSTKTVAELECIQLPFEGPPVGECPPHLGTWMIWLVHRVALNDPSLVELWFEGYVMPLPDDEPRVAPKLAKSLGSNTHLKYLHLGDSCLQGGPTAVSIATSLTTNNTLELLDLRCNYLETEDLVIIFEALGRNTGLLDLKVDKQYNEEVGYEALQALSEALRRNGTITKVGIALTDQFFRDPIMRSLIANVDAARKRRYEAKQQLLQLERQAEHHDLYTGDSWSDRMAAAAALFGTGSAGTIYAVPAPAA
mmetsp:Transcript_48410/g.122090  ORF Transcript_48410/g.122090 Transcript_48410/m.122090 type:complete len:890 (+) Transcript_48410:99-2768(+)